MPSPSHIRSLYRSLLRELPARPLSSPSPIQQRIRRAFSTPHNTNPPDTTSPDINNNTNITHLIEETEQYIQYARAQRMYVTLLERYNPGIGSAMDEEERVRLTARRVGMNLPEEWRGH